MSGKRDRSSIGCTAISLAARGCALAAAALLLTLATQEIADASCGDYVLVRDASGRLVSASGLAARNKMPPAHSADPARRPCQGPACSQRPSLPPATPPAPIVWPSTPEGLLATLSGGADRPESDSPYPDSATAQVIHHPGRVFRPPRILAHA